MTKSQAILFTKKQFKSLLKAVYLGSWMANAFRTDDVHKDYESIEDYIFSQAPEFGMDKYVDHEATDGDKYFPTSTFEQTTDVHKLHEQYDEETFCDEMAEKFGEKEFFERYSTAEIKKMSRDEYFYKLSECVDNVEEELALHGLGNFKRSKPTKPQ